MEASCPAWHGVDRSQSAPLHVAPARSSLLRQPAMIAVIGMFVLLPVQAVDLPLNLAPVDLWNVVGLPLIWIYLLAGKRALRVPYVGAMGLVLLGGLLGMMSTRDATTSSIVLLKEIYLYVWFSTLATLFVAASARDLRTILVVWCTMVLLHGSIIVGEFLSDDLWQRMASFFGSLSKVEVIRPPGLFDNANGAAFFQLMGFVPVLLGLRSSILAMTSAVALVLSIIGTGSLGASSGLVAGMAVAFVAMAVAGGERRTVYKTLVWIIAIGALLSGLYAIVLSRAPDYDDRLAYYFYSRMERSATGRFGLWQSGLAVLFSPTSFFGVGPGNFADPLTGKSLHNDLLVFILERGFIGALGLLTLGAIAGYKALRMLGNSQRRADLLVGGIFLAAMVAAAVESQFHQVFHERALWLVLALQEAMLVKTMAARKHSLASAETQPRTQ